MEKRYIRKDGSVVWINLTVALVHKTDGSPEYFVSVIEDIDEKRRMKESLYKLNNKLEQRVAERTRELSVSNQKLEATLKKLYEAEEQMLQAEKMAAMGTFAAGIAHELNNPLTGVLNYIQYTRDKIDDEKLKGYLDKAEHDTLRAAKVIENMLAYSRRSQPGEEDINIATVIEQSVDIMRPELNREHIALELDLDPALPPVKVNADTLEQVFINLMGNARDAMEGYADKRLYIQALEMANNIQVSIKDTGGGIPEHVGGKIFDPFFTTKPPGKGTGLGLGLCQRIISNLGGTIRFDSNEGQGTTFYIHIPVINQTS
jgi:C4-dicarboxylate-specific signal transduction histidine kinase